MKIFFEYQYKNFLDYMKDLMSSSEPFNCSNLIYVPEFVTYYTENGPHNIEKGSLICLANSFDGCVLRDQVKSLDSTILDIMAVRCRFNQE